MDFQFEQLEPAPIRPREQQSKEIWQPRWNCFCCHDTGKVQIDLVRRVIPKYDDNRDRIPICQNCDKGQEWAHLNELGVIDMRLTFQICSSLDALAREDWRRTTQTWFEMASKQISLGTTEIAQRYNLRRRSRIQAECILKQERHGKARGDWEEIKEQEE
jgi:hypothetical protein